MGQYRIVLLIQSIYYFVTALWALIHIRSFMEITGPKTDVWLVKTVAVLLLAIAISFFTSFFLRTIHIPVMTLAIACCLVLLFIDCYYVWNGTISKIYLLDALAEVFLLILWAIIITKHNKRK
jgi:hypothetical protein